MDASLFLCDWAEVVQSKLYAQGMGWVNTPADIPNQHAVACLISVPYPHTNEKHQVSLTLVTEDGQPVPPEVPAVFAFGFEVGRPPGMKPGQEQNVPFAGKIGGVVFTVGGYRWELAIDDTLEATAAFVATKQGMPTP